MNIDYNTVQSFSNVYYSILNYLNYINKKKDEAQNRKLLNRWMLIANCKGFFDEYLNFDLKGLINVVEPNDNIDSELLNHQLVIIRNDYDIYTNIHKSPPHKLLYSILGIESDNMHLSYPPKLILSQEYDFELFGTPYNTCTPRYCSPFNCEKGMINLYGGISQGNFFDYSLEPNIKYLCNPPFIETLCELMTNRLVDELSRLKSENKETHVTVILPDWIDFKALDILLNCKFIVEKKKDTIKYFHYGTKRNVNIGKDSIIIELSSNNKNETIK
jgi:hypothetical protein